MAFAQSMVLSTSNVDMQDKLLHMFTFNVTSAIVNPPAIINPSDLG